MKTPAPGTSAPPFVKMQGIGNDFVVLDALAHTYLRDADFAALALQLCARGFGVGGDGLLLLDEADEAAGALGCAVRMRMWNPDGSEDMCGNGLRCVARLAHRRGYVDAQFTVQTLVGPRRAWVDAENVRVEMGAPLWDAEEIPLDTRLIDGEPQRYFLDLDGERVGPLCSVSTGSTHTVFFTDQATIARDFERLSAKLEVHPAFPQRSSILWAQVLADGELGVRIWERGVGETLACGTGACAVAVAAMKLGLLDAQAARVHSRGGVLEIAWAHKGEGLGAVMWKSGAARVVFESG